MRSAPSPDRTAVAAAARPNNSFISFHGRDNPVDHSFALLKASEPVSKF
jgi:hypothetical protein